MYKINNAFWRQWTMFKQIKLWHTYVLNNNIHVWHIFWNLMFILKLLWCYFYLQVVALLCVMWWVTPPLYVNDHLRGRRDLTYHVSLCSILNNESNWIETHSDIVKEVENNLINPVVDFRGSLITNYKWATWTSYWFTALLSTVLPAFLRAHQYRYYHLIVDSNRYRANIDIHN